MKHLLLIFLGVAAMNAEASPYTWLQKFCFRLSTSGTATGPGLIQVNGSLPDGEWDDNPSIVASCEKYIKTPNELRCVAGIRRHPEYIGEKFTASFGKYSLKRIALPVAVLEQCSHIDQGRAAHADIDQDDQYSLAPEVRANVEATENL